MGGWAWLPALSKAVSAFVPHLPPHSKFRLSSLTECLRRVLAGFLFEGGVVVAVEETLVDVGREESVEATELLVLAGVDALVGDEGAVLEEGGADKDAVAQGEAGGVGDAEIGPAFEE